MPIVKGLFPQAQAQKLPYLPKSRRNSRSSAKSLFLNVYFACGQHRGFSAYSPATITRSNRGFAVGAYIDDVDADISSLIPASALSLAMRMTEAGTGSGITQD